MNLQTIPITSDPDQIFQVTLAVNGGSLTLELEIKFNSIAGYWVMTITDPDTDTVLLDSIPLNTSITIADGVNTAMNLLGQYAYMNLGSVYLVNVSGIDMDYPDNTNLGKDFELIWTDNPGYNG
jgi:hypothetical protein